MHKFLVTILFSVLAVSAVANPEQIIRAKFKQMMPQLPIDSISKTQVNNLYQVTSGAQVLYVSNDAKIIIQGDMYDVQNPQQPVNLSDSIRQVGAKGVIDKVDPATMIIYAAKDQKAVITVFTDIDCTYCRALHKELKDLNDAGITVRYLSFPRTPKGTPSYNKAIYVWCAQDRNTAYSEAINGKDPAVANCKHPVDDHHKVAEELSINVTPVIIMQNGKMVPGYLPAPQLIKMAMDNRE